MYKSTFIQIVSFEFNDLIICAGKRIGPCICVAGIHERPHHGTRQGDRQVLQYAAEYKNEQNFLILFMNFFYRIFFYRTTFLTFN